MRRLQEGRAPALRSDKMRELWRLGAPTVMEQALQTFVLYIDTAMVGRIGAGASAAVGLTTTVNWLFNGIFFQRKRSYAFPYRQI